MFTRTRYQDGCLTREKRKRGPDVWVFLWRETSENGKRRQKKLLIGTVKEFTSLAAAQRTVAVLKADINKECGPQTISRVTLTFGQLTEHYLQKELPKKAYSTGAAYQNYLNNWILPRWRDYRLRDLKAIAVEEWLGSLKHTATKKGEVPDELAPGTKAKLRNIMHAIYAHAIRYEWTDANPITAVRQSAKRLRIPDVLTAEETKALVSELQQPYLSLVLLDAATGLRRSELLALKWCDVDFLKLEITVKRGIVNQVVGDVKTEASRQPVPLSPLLANVLRDWKARSIYNEQDHWIFASPVMDGKQPLWPENLLTRHIRPASERANICKHVGFHTFRHSLATLLKANGEDVKTVQELLRHANSRITLDFYTQAVTHAKRAAQDRLVESFVSEQMERSAEANAVTVTFVTAT